MSPPTEIPVLEIYRGYLPSFNAGKLVRRLLRTVPASHLSRLGHVVLTNGSMLVDRTPDASHASANKQHVLGVYHPWRWKRPAYIELRVDAISKQLNLVSLGIPIVRELAFGYVLFHEIGHHMHLKHNLIRPDLLASEGFADQWSQQLMVSALRQHYRHFRPLWNAAIKTYRFVLEKKWLESTA